MAITARPKADQALRRTGGALREDTVGKAKLETRTGALYAKEMSDDRDARHWEAVEEASELLLEGQHGAALEELRRIIGADPMNPYAYHYIGVACYELGQLEAARDAYAAAVTLAPNYLASRVALSHTHRRLGEHAAAVSEAIEALGRFPDDGDALCAAGLAHMARGDKRKAREDLLRFLDARPELEARMEVEGML